MGRAINTDNRLGEHDIKFEELEARIKFLEDIFAEQSPNATRVHHVDLTDVENLRTEGVEVTPDETAGRRKIEDSPIGAGFTHKDTKAKKKRGKKETVSA